MIFDLSHFIHLFDNCYGGQVVYGGQGQIVPNKIKRPWAREAKANVPFHMSCFHIQYTN